MILIKFAPCFVSNTKRNIFLSSTKCKRIFKYPKLISNEVIRHPQEKFDNQDECLNSLKRKLVYNSVVSHRNSSVRWLIRRDSIASIKEQHERRAVPLSLKYAYKESELNFDEYRQAHLTESINDTEKDNVFSENSAPVSLPYSIFKEVEFTSDTTALESTSENIPFDFHERDCSVISPGKKWMSDYEVYEEDDSDSMNVPESDYGTANPHILPSKIPCGGCGAHLHCQNSSIPGFLPQELYLRCSENDLRQVICQRCTFLKHYNIALSVNVDPKTYPQLLSKIKNERALVILMVDMLDFPCSIWPNMLDIIGRNKPLILVGNKVDLLPGDSPGWLHHAKKVLLNSFPPTANILHVALISAKTRFGVEELINKINSLWQTKGNVYLIGCTNVGKSSLFNNLLHSDFCKTQCIDLIQRATVAPWPGTTLNLLKFPILKMNAWRYNLRKNRLDEEKQSLIAERNLERMLARDAKVRFSPLPKIEGFIGLSFDKELVSTEAINDFIMPTSKKEHLKQNNQKVFDPNAENLRFSKWCFDTPGVVHEDQIINILTTEELMKVLPQKIIKPRVFSIYPKQSLIIAGLARIDLVECDAKMARLIVYASELLPISLCPTENFDEVYDTLLGTKYFAVPSGDSNRLKQWPPLKCSKDFEFTGRGNVTSLGDIVLSSAGWISPLAAHNIKFVLRPFTPDGRGIYLRKTPLLRFTSMFRKRRVSNTPTYFMSHL